MQFESPTPSEAYIHVTTIYMADHAISNNSSERPHAAVISLFRHITAGVNAYTATIISFQIDRHSMRFMQGTQVSPVH